MDGTSPAFMPKPPGSLRAVAGYGRSMGAISLLCLALYPSPVLGQACLDAELNGDVVNISVEVAWNSLPSFSGVVVQRWTVGLCDEARTITPAPWPRETLPPGTSTRHYSMTESMPGHDRCYGYVVRAVDAAGELHDLCDLGQMPFDFVSCGDAIIVRGRFPAMFQDPRESYLLFEGCSEGCWWGRDYIDFGRVDPETYRPYIFGSVTLDVYGYFLVSDMLPNVLIVATHVTPTLSGQCGPLPQRVLGWGQVKQMYR